ncbi:MAG: hypothetical protein ACRYHQ_41500 [Janthinobacterium lividum]
MMDVLSRRALLAGDAAVAAAVPAAVAVLPAMTTPGDAELVRVCHQFAEAEYREWWRYVTTPDHLADAEATDPDWATLEWIETTPATTPAGWAAKALALAAFHRETYDDSDAEGDASATLLAGLLRDMVAPTRAEILARCAAEYGPLPAGYTADARWIGRAPVAPVAAAPIPFRSDAELLAACDAFTRAEQEVARLEAIRETPDNVFEPAVAIAHATVVRVAGLRAYTVGGLLAKAAVCRAVYAADEPVAMAGIFGGKAQRHDVLAWATLADLVEVAR